MRKQRLLTLLLLSAAISTPIAQAAVRVEVSPILPGGIPVYARMGLTSQGDFFHTEEWAAIVFYRKPECVPEDFNLIQLPPFDIPGAFGCPLTVAGFEIWENGPPPFTSDQAPLFSNLRAPDEDDVPEPEPVPVWFVSWPELQAQIEDGVLTITDLENMSSLQIGLATFFLETLHPTLGPWGAGGVGGAQHANMNIVASGQLLDGRSFIYHVSVGEQGHGAQARENVRNISIEFE